MTNIKTNEKPLTGTGANSRNFKLSINNNIAIFTRCWLTKVMMFIFSLGGISPFIIIPYVERTSLPSLDQLWGKGFIVYLILLTLMILMIRFFYWVATTPHCFNLSTGLYYYGKKPNDKAVRISSITAIQVIRKYVYSSSNFYSFELNLVTNSGKRINVIDHSEGEWIKLEAKQLADFLKVEFMLINTK